VAPPVDLSVIVAALDPDRTLDASLDALEQSCEGLAAEILAIGAAPARRAVESGRHPRIHFHVVGGDPSVPDLWATGIGLATGRVIALSTSHLIVESSWARALMAALILPSGGAGGPIDLMPDSTTVDRAIFYLRYSPFLASAWPDGAVAGEIAGDNAAYWADDLRRHQADHPGGFWEVEFHRRLRAAGRPLAGARAAMARLGRSHRAGAFIRQRLRHGRHFGHQRVKDRERGRWAMVLAAPIVPLILAARAARRVWPSPPHRLKFLVALPAFLTFAAAWAVGEAAGALIGDGAGR